LDRINGIYRIGEGEESDRRNIKDMRVKDFHGTLHHSVILSGGEGKIFLHVRLEGLGTRR
jgi:hypothetical protein